MIAISYRREDSLPIAGRLYDRLQGEFGKGNVFMDFDSIPYGVDFRDHIKQMIDRSKVVVAMIGPDWLGRRRHRGRRIDDPADFVRIEIGYALERGIPIIPILINDTLMPRPTELPKDIEGLAFRNALTLDVGIDFHHHIDRLVAGINRLLIMPPPSARPAKEQALRSTDEISSPAEATNAPSAKPVETPKPIQPQATVPPPQTAPPVRSEPISISEASTIPTARRSQSSENEPLAQAQKTEPAIPPERSSARPAMAGTVTRAKETKKPSDGGKLETLPIEAKQQSPPRDLASTSHEKSTPTSLHASRQIETLPQRPKREDTKQVSVPFVAAAPGQDTKTEKIQSSAVVIPPKTTARYPFRERSKSPDRLQRPTGDQKDEPPVDWIDPAVLKRIQDFLGVVRKSKTTVLFGGALLSVVIILAVVTSQQFATRKTAEARREPLSSPTSAPSPVPTIVPSATGNIPSSGALLVSSDPPGIDFEIVDSGGGHYRGTTPETITGLREGAANVTYKKESIEYKESAWVRADQPSSITWQAPRRETPPSRPITSPPPPKVNWEAALQDFVREYVESNAFPDAEREVSFYAPVAEIFNEGRKDAASIRHDILSYRTKWPIRNSRVRGDIHISQIAPDEYLASFEQTYHVENSARHETKNGSVSVTLGIGIFDGFPKITSIKNGPPPPRTTSPTQSPVPSLSVIPGSPQKLVRIFNKTYGFSALVPSEVFPDAARPSEVDRTVFSDAAGHTTLRLLARKNTGGGAFDRLYREWTAEHTAAQPHKKVHYKPFRGKWFVVSGTDGVHNERGFYIKAVNKGSIIVTMLFEYDEDSSPLTNETLLKISQAFDGN